MRKTNAIYSGIPTTIFEVMSQLARQHDAVNLGQGFPDVDGPIMLRELAAKALIEGPNQYPPMPGLPVLRQSVANSYARFQEVDLDWQSQIIITSGATEALSDCINGLIDPGDEVVLLEPLYDCYAPLVERAGGIIRLVRLNPPDWTLPVEALEAAFSARTKLILLNNPMNPAGKVFSRSELELIAELCDVHDAFIVADEVYEHLTFDGKSHISVLSVPKAVSRSVAIGSAGKTFSMTGWKVGTVAGAAHMIEPIAKAHQFTTFTTPPHLQVAVAEGLALPDSYFAEIKSDLERKRDRLAQGLSALNFTVGRCEAAYFLNADFSALTIGETDVEACQAMVRDARVATVPVSAFYKGDAPPRNFLRFCFCKRDDVLDQALERISTWLKKSAADPTKAR
jgi:aspartate/methionine/tyrosine aminotransferase